MPNYIFSTCTNDISFAVYGPRPEGMAINNVRKFITVKGGANLNTRLPNGTIGIKTHGLTMVSDDDLEILRQNKSFLKGIENGFFIVSDKKDQDVLKNMKKKSRSAQKERDDFKDIPTSFDQKFTPEIEFVPEKKG